MLKCIFGQEQHIMSNQVGVSTCRDDHNEYISVEAGTILNKVHCWHSKCPGSTLAFDTISLSCGFYSGKWRRLQKSLICDKSSRALLTSVWSSSQQQHSLNTSLLCSSQP